MIDLHTHTLLSDGVLLPSELVRRGEEIGYEVIAITDHADSSNLDFVIPRLIAASKSLNETTRVKVIPGVELTHIAPGFIPELVERSRGLGARLVIVHGETLVEPVAEGTNLAALKCEIDILAHPGLLTPQEAALARERDVYLEITARSGHALTNGHVVRMARESGALLIFNTDAHGPEDIIDQEMAEKIARGAGLGGSEFEGLMANSKDLIKRISG